MAKKQESKTLTTWLQGDLSHLEAALEKRGWAWMVTRSGPTCEKGYVKIKIEEVK